MSQESRSRRNRQRATAREEGSTFLRALIVLFSAVAVALAGYLVWSLANNGAAGGASGGAGAGALQLTPEVTGAPKLRVDHETIDLGDVKLGDTVRVAFKLTNTGDQPLRFTGQPSVEVVEGC